MTDERDPMSEQVTTGETYLELLERLERAFDRVQRVLLREDDDDREP